ncbi:hypothetical protein RRG08_048494 [Elysia crispata]|uniref:Uncharacterized protein n=1 Tax=Elysia crispata TaxID=231223 RepID=A0AAE0YNK4_9GAST|nr:hypothetical protein RRG08_048494 [Elysia crispata]
MTSGEGSAQPHSGQTAVNPILDSKLTCVMGLDTMRIMTYGEGSGQPHSGLKANLCHGSRYYENNDIWGGLRSTPFWTKR